MLVQKRDMLINSIKKHICTTLAMAYIILDKGGDKPGNPGWPPEEWRFFSQSFSSFKLGPGFFFLSFTLPILHCNGPKLG
jgi:hypothetical protein